MIKPEFWSDPDVAKLSFGARLLFVGIWNFCDDYGVCLNSDRKLLGEIFPHDEKITTKQVKKWLSELISLKMILPVEFEENKFLIVRTWEDHQKVPNPSERRWLDSETQSRLIREYLESNDGEKTVSLYKDKENVKEKDKGKGRPQSFAELLEYCLSVNLTAEDAKDWLNHFEANGYRIGKALAPMKDWRAAVRTWKSNKEKWSGSNGHRTITGGIKATPGKYADLDK